MGLEISGAHDECPCNACERLRAEWKERQRKEHHRATLIDRLQATQSQAQREQALYGGWGVMGDAAEEIARLRAKVCAGCHNKSPLLCVAGEFVHQIETVGFYEVCTAIEAAAGTRRP